MQHACDNLRFSFVKSFSLLQELLAMVPQPVLGMLLLFPITKESEAAKDAGESLSLVTLSNCRKTFSVYL